MDNSTSPIDQIGPVRTIFVTVDTHKISGVGIGLPPNSFLATLLLSDLLVASLNPADLFIGRGGGCGPLDRSSYYFQVSNANAASRIIIGVLKKYGLHAWARIYRFDDSEKIWRCLFPEGGNAADFAAWSDELTAALKATEQYVERLGIIQKQNPPDNGLGK